MNKVDQPNAIDPIYLDKLKAIIGEQALQQVFNPIEQAAGLPYEAYWSQSYLDLEWERIFARNWVFAGSLGELSQPGSVKPIEIAGQPLIIVHDEDGEVRAFHNVCRHRGSMLVDKPCKKHVITCPYHAWVYKLNGRLKARPHFYGPDKGDKFPEGATDKALNLIPVRCEVWNGLIFVNISSQADSLENWLAPMLKELSGYDLSALQYAGKLEFEVKANWKMVYENYMEGYHVFAVHPKLHQFAPMNLRWPGRWDKHVFINDYEFPKLEQGRGDGLPHYPNLSGKNLQRGLWFLVFPHFAVELWPDQFAVFVSYPIAPDRTKEELHIFLNGEAAISDRYKEARNAVFNMWDDLNREDIRILETVQKGRASRQYHGGQLSPYWEAPTWAFCQKLVENIIKP